MGGSHESQGGVGRGREGPQEVQEWLGGPPKVREGSGVPLGGPEVVWEGPSEGLGEVGSGRKAPPEVRELSGGPPEVHEGFGGSPEFREGSRGPIRGPAGVGWAPWSF